MVLPDIVDPAQIEVKEKPLRLESGSNDSSAGEGDVDLTDMFNYHATPQNIGKKSFLRIKSDINNTLDATSD